MAGKQHFDQLGLHGAYDSPLETVLPAWSPTVTRPPCLRGVSTLTSFGLAVEIGDWLWFTGSTIGAFLGLVSTESSSGEGRSQGSITKTGNMLARRLLVEATCHHRRP